MKLADIFEAYYGRRSPETIEPTPDTPFLHSYVPYLAGQTNVVAYNFLRSNYNLRDPVLLDVRVHSEGHPQVSKSLRRIFAPEEVLLLDAESLDQLAGPSVKRGSVHLRLFHPRIATANGEFRFLAHYHSPGTGCAGVHSLGARGLSVLGPAFGSRAVLSHGRRHLAVDPQHLFPVQAKCTISALSAVEACDHPLHGPSFFIATDAVQRVTAVWHDSDMARVLTRASTPQTTCRVRQAFPILDFPRRAPLAWIAADQVGFAPECLRITIRDDQGRFIAERSISTPQTPSTIDLSQIFRDAQAIERAYAVVDLGGDHGEFEGPALGYMHLWYPGLEGSGDQVHSQITPSFWTDPLAEAVSFRCRKFAPWTSQSGIEWIYAVVNVGGVGGNRDCHVRFRIHTDQGAERVVEMPLPDEHVGFFSANDLLAAARVPSASSAIVQIESETTNFNAFWIVRDLASGAFGIDHFTGG